MYISRPYPTIGLGGTFDHFHRGHQKFISFAATHGEELVIGITVPEMIGHKRFVHSLESYQARVAQVKIYCRRQNIRAKVLPLRDVYGPTIDDRAPKALAVTTETVGGATKINQIRRAAGFNELPTFICQLAQTQAGEPLHAELIRAGQINRDGRVYLHNFRQDLVLTEKQKSRLTLPLGRIVEQPHFTEGNLNIVVGDITWQAAITEAWPIDLAFIDGRSNRQTIDNQADFGDGEAEIINPAGQISLATWDWLRQWQQQVFQSQLKNKKPKVVKVLGEEDLITTATILASPLGTQIYYGQPNQGLVEVIVTEALKNEHISLLS